MTTRTVPTRSTQRPRVNKYAYLIAADLFTVIAVMGVYFLSQPSKEGAIVAMIAIVVAGLFLVVPLLLDSRRSRSDAMAALETMRGDIADNQRSIHDSIRTLSESVARHTAIAEKAVTAQVNTFKQNDPSTVIFARLDAYAVRALDTRPLNFQPILDSISGRLDACIEANQRLETRLEQCLQDYARTTAATEPDGALPQSLVAKAFATNQTSGNAIARIIGNGASAKPAIPEPISTENRQPIEDEIWNAAADMANAEADTNDDNRDPSALLPKTAPTPVDESQDKLDLTNHSELQTPEKPAENEPANIENFAPDESGTESSANESKEESALPKDEDTEDALPSQPDIASGTELLDSGMELSSLPDEEEPGEDSKLEEDPESELEGEGDPEFSLEDQDTLAPLQFDLLDGLGLQQTEAPRRPKRTATANATVFIIDIPPGIPGMPYLRGFGPGLSEDIGFPMKLIAPGRWRWISPDPSKGARVTIWQNDIRRANSAPLDIPPNSTVEYTPEFPA